MLDTVLRSAEWSVDRKKRYVLGRFWGERPFASVICLNPSTADDTQDDPTNRRLIGLLSSQGFGGYWLLNLIPDIATDPRTVQWRGRRMSARNKVCILHHAAQSDCVVLAWGATAKSLEFRHRVREWFPTAQCFGVTRGGEPRHPLYLPNRTALCAYQQAVDSGSLSAPR